MHYNGLHKGFSYLNLYSAILMHSIHLFMADKLQVTMKGTNISENHGNFDDQELISILVQGCIPPYYKLKHQGQDSNDACDS